MSVQPEIKNLITSIQILISFLSIGLEFEEDLGNNISIEILIEL